MTTNSVHENLQQVLGRIAAAAGRAGRRSEEITLIGISKTHSAEAVREAYAAGVRHFGENRVQEWEKKRGPLADLGATWHLVGHLQSNKAARAAELFGSVDSVHDAALARRLDRAREQSGSQKKLRVLIEVRLAPEESKSGVEIASLSKLAEELCGLPHLEFAGLMCIPPYFKNAESARPFFMQLRKLRGDLTKLLGRELPALSMGMSHDFEIAVEEGATEVRIGTALFGERTSLGGV
ncbi:MAG TPA: YggS family pyridoxal phosphate-dependent enzyme [Terriglobales bacterium]|nr:YggS family pyridoxal phosphate-dependent enzyme [Terriglobales bacterium]